MFGVLARRTTICPRLFAKSYTKSLPALRFEESEAAKLQREESRNLSSHNDDESTDSDRVYRLSIRKVTRGTEDAVKSYMETVSRKIRRVDGLIEVEVLVSSDLEGESETYNVLTHWKNQESLDDWLDSDVCHQVRTDLDKMLAEPVSVRTFRNFVEPTFTL
jgi:heme-degrading monooxygenase HmoA